ncbi:hypothetical protein HC251_15525 [Iamia sp. SCSIO 61187]|uniref:hypothetical protein n=1 Tax=Iamia sp. SCSIO 61187 TaxID=2722752 RepID=UPI001C631003|nr:hypothetical protein [Iamia sp. SCSIO 61187]QYG93694.1 hypothetical protein HC251_15525 [Iamia sp. SCSIO 61187]
MLSHHHPDTGAGTGRDRGSSLMLMPAAVLVFVVLGAFCVDFGAIHLGQRELVTAAQGAANDAAAAGFDEAAFYGGGAVTLDPVAARQAAEVSLADNAPGAEITRFSVDEAEATVEIAVTIDVETVFSKALPGGPDTVAVTGRATSDLAQ